MQKCKVTPSPRKPDDMNTTNKEKMQHVRELVRAFELTNQANPEIYLERIRACLTGTTPEPNPRTQICPENPHISAQQKHKEIGTSIV